MRHSCDVYVRAAEHGDDIERLKHTYALADIVIDCLETAAPGRLEWAALVDDSPVDVDVFGAGLKFSFFYDRGILHNAKRWVLPSSEDDNSTGHGALSPGDTAANGVTVTPTTTVQE
jgi:hypothetical protein